MIDDVQSFVAAAEVLKERGAYKIYVMATHGLLSQDAPRLIEDSPIDEVCELTNILGLSISSDRFPNPTGGRYQYRSARDPEDAVSQDQNGRHQHSTG